MSDSFLCVHFKCRLSPAACVARQREACADHARDCYCTSKSCAQGRQVAQELLGHSAGGAAPQPGLTRLQRAGTHRYLSDREVGRIRRYLQRLGRSRTELAAELDVHYMRLTDWISQKTRAPRVVIALLARILQAGREVGTK